MTKTPVQLGLPLECLDCGDTITRPGESALDTHRRNRHPDAGALRYEWRPVEDVKTEHV